MVVPRIWLSRAVLPAAWTVSLRRVAVTLDVITLPGPDLLMAFGAAHTAGIIVDPSPSRASRSPRCTPEERRIDPGNARTESGSSPGAAVRAPVPCEHESGANTERGPIGPNGSLPLVP